MAARPRQGQGHGDASLAACTHPIRSAPQMRRPKKATASLSSPYQTSQAFLSLSLSLILLPPPPPHPDESALQHRGKDVTGTLVSHLAAPFPSSSSPRPLQRVLADPDRALHNARVPCGVPGGPTGSQCCPLTQEPAVPFPCTFWDCPRCSSSFLGFKGFLPLSLCPAQGAARGWGSRDESHGCLIPWHSRAAVGWARGTGVLGVLLGLLLRALQREGL